MLKIERKQIKIVKVSSLLSRLLKERLEMGLSKLSVQKNKFKIKEKALVVMRRLILSKISENCRWFITRCG